MAHKNKNEVLEYLKSHTWTQTASHFNISEMTISRWLKTTPQNLDYKVALTKLLKWRNPTVHKYAKIIENKINELQR